MPGTDFKFIVFFFFGNLLFFNKHLAADGESLIQLVFFDCSYDLCIHNLG